MEEDSKEYVHQNEDELKIDYENDDDARFTKSLQELRDLRSQLHYAADYCKSTFLNAKQKKAVIHNTKDYICRAVVTVVDHLGNVSSNLVDKLTCDNYSVSRTEFCLNSLYQRISACEEYTNKVALTNLRWNPSHPSYHPRYLSKSIKCLERLHKDSSADSECPTGEAMPIVLLTYNPKPEFARNLTQEEQNAKKDDKRFTKVFPVRGALSTSPIFQNNAFHFQDASKRERSSGTLVKRTMHHAADKLSFIRRTKQPPPYPQLRRENLA